MAILSSSGFPDKCQDFLDESSFPPDISQNRMCPTCMSTSVHFPFVILALFAFISGVRMGMMGSLIGASGYLHGRSLPGGCWWQGWARGSWEVHKGSQGGVVRNKGALSQGIGVGSSRQVGVVGGVGESGGRSRRRRHSGVVGGGPSLQTPM